MRETTQHGLQRWQCIASQLDQSKRSLQSVPKDRELIENSFKFREIFGAMNRVPDVLDLVELSSIKSEIGGLRGQLQKELINAGRLLLP